MSRAVPFKTLVVSSSVNLLTSAVIYNLEHLKTCKLRGQTVIRRTVMLEKQSAVKKEKEEGSRYFIAESLAVNVYVLAGKC